MKKLSILGSTGSIGQSVLSLVDLHPDRFEVVGLAARSSARELSEQVARYRPKVAALHESRAAEQLARTTGGCRLLSELAGVVEVATHPDADVVVAGISGAAGLVPTYQAVAARKDVALANKETLVMAGQMIMRMVQENQTRLVPVDSEHSALHQCLQGAHGSQIRRLLLTASGGPFWGWERGQLEKVTVDEALDHPTWQMGPKITVDSATLMNKGLEVIEAHHLFGVAAQQISIVIHPQSTVHSMVEFIDGTVLAQMSITDMRSALLYALSYPERWESNLPPLDFFSLSPLEFHAPDLEKFPCIRLAYQCLKHGDTYPTVLNAANEVAVAAFLEGQISFPAIPEIVEEVLNEHQPHPAESLETVLQVDQRCRHQAARVVQTRVSRSAVPTRG